MIAGTREPAPLQPFGIDPLAAHKDCRKPARKAARSCNKIRAHAGDDVRADPDELMHHGKAAEDRVIADLHVPGQLRVVGEDGVVADLAVVRQKCT